ncbi:MAG: polysaccharide deacetylase family protein [Blastococcus sp.]|jgi:peptidoglycan/xylan/chitin deacetylase (PgdA/CDA1 family)|nr:polysaccharide deacetylase family protein [Blastococcus sp.]
MVNGQRRSGRSLVTALLVAAMALTAPVAQAGPATSPAPQEPSPPLPEGPWPPSEVLAADPATVAAPRVGTQAATACPAAGYGVNNSAPGSGKTVALTFDDGPGASTDAILQILDSAGVAATFFNIGVNETVRPSTVRAEAARGYLLGSHSWSHPDLTTLSSSAQALEMDRTTAEQVSLVGSPPCFFRPPYGSYNSTTLALAQARNMKVFNWSVDTEDWKAAGSGSSSWVNRIISLAQAGGSQSHPVVLMHNQPGGNPATVSALPSIISYYRDHGYQFVDLNGQVADRPVTGDWDGNGTVTPGVVRGNTWYLRNSNTSGPPDMAFQYGGPTDRVVTGDWDGNGTTTPGVVRGNTWYLRNSNSSGPGLASFTYGGSTDRVVTGDWDGNGTTTVGVVRGNIWYLRNSNSSGPGLAGFGYGGPSDRVVTGDWDGSGTTTVGVVRGSNWYLRNSNSSGPGMAGFGYGGPSDRPITGDWDGNGTTTIGVDRGANWYLRSTNTSGIATTSFTFAP